MSRERILEIVIMAFMKWLLKDEDHDGTPDILEGFSKAAKDESPKSDAA